MNDIDTIPFDARRAIELGDAGEHIACADLLLAGHRAFQASQGGSYDVLADVGGRLLRIAVKSTVAPRRRVGRPGSRGIYQFAVGRSRRDHTGKASRRAYSAEDVDIVALVALDIRRVACLPLPDCPTTVEFAADHGATRTSEFGPRSVRPVRLMADFTFDRALADFLSKC